MLNVKITYKAKDDIKLIYVQRSKGYSTRKSVDIEKLENFGYDIIHVDNRNGGGYYMGTRAFEMAELKLLVDAVQSSRFITEKKSAQLIKKLEKLTKHRCNRHSF